MRSFQNLQSGATERRMKGGNIEDEHCSQDSNAPGTLSMANSGQPNTGGSQFFINIADNSFLDWFSPGASKHTVFGRIRGGFDVAVAISQQPTNEDRPKKPVKLLAVKIIETDDRDALLRACHVGHLAAVRLLLQDPAVGVSAAAVDEAGRSALELAASAGHSAVVRLLAEQLEGETWKLGNLKAQQHWWLPVVMEERRSSASSCRFARTSMAATLTAGCSRWPRRPRGTTSLRSARCWRRAPR
ncbi:unnamed protein product [Cladocopium goreaui]|uniref:peptidylprolyl isomerase n=1 Tax=Cladocopium goreaui TaxID=2562237 RepID=A0A9P1FRB2_9DINO|nr:unnamed protein product [Cladocopium goreaui]